MKYEDITPEMVMSLFTGILLCDFSKLQDMVEWLLSRPVMTHEFADKRVMNQAREALVMIIAEKGFKAVNGVSPDALYINKVSKEILEKYPFRGVTK